MLSVVCQPRIRVTLELKTENIREFKEEVNLQVSFCFSHSSYLEKAPLINPSPFLDSAWFPSQSPASGMQPKA